MYIAAWTFIRVRKCYAKRAIRWIFDGADLLPIQIEIDLNLMFELIPKTTKYLNIKIVVYCTL